MGEDVLDSLTIQSLSLYLKILEKNKNIKNVYHSKSIVTTWSWMKVNSI